MERLNKRAETWKGVIESKGMTVYGKKTKVMTSKENAIAEDYSDI